MEAPRADNSEGLMAVGDVLGARTVVVGGKRFESEEARRGVWEVPPERITWWEISIPSRASWGNEDKPDQYPKCQGLLS